jgi:hypothetical protein
MNKWGKSREKSLDRIKSLLEHCQNARKWLDIARVILCPGAKLIGFHKISILRHLGDWCTNKDTERCSRRIASAFLWLTLNERG